MRLELAKPLHALQTHGEALSRVLLIAGAVLLMVGGLVACGGGDGPPGRGGPGGPGGPWGGGGPRKEPVSVVEVQRAELGEVADVLQATAVIEAERAASVVPEASGIVLSLHADEGDVVKRGQLLAVLDNVSLDASAERASVEVQRLEKQYQELEQLAQRGAVSARELEDVRWQLQTARSSAREATRTYGQTRVTAPFDGVIARRDGRVGELASSGAALFEVVDLTALRAVASLPERDIHRAAVGQPARLVSAYDEEIFANGEVVRVSPVVDATSGTFRVTVEVDPDGPLRPGQFVSVHLEVDRRTEVVVVPKRAVVYEDGAPILYTMIDAPEEEGDEVAEADRGKGGSASAPARASWFGGSSPPAEEEAADEEPEGPKYVANRVRVQLGLVDSTHAEITRGIEVGDQVIVLGQSHLRDGARVRTVDAAERAEQAERVGAEAAAAGDEG